MATRSTISVLHKDGTVSSVYSHWDGYLSNNGRLLVTHYNTQARAEKLVSFGNISSLGLSVGKRHDFDDRDHDMTTYYARDRNESGQAAERFGDLKTFQREADFQEYNYLWANGKWLCSQGRPGLSSARVKEAVLEFCEA